MPNTVFWRSNDSPVHQGAWLPDLEVETLAAAKTLVVGDPTVLSYDPGGSSRNVTLPAEASSMAKLFIIVNDSSGAGENLVVKSDGGTTIGTVADGEMGLFICDGTQWATPGSNQLLLVDDEALTFGNDSDLEVKWDGSDLVSGPPTGLWAGCPSPLNPDPGAAFVLEEDFFVYDAGDWTVTEDDAACTQAVSNVAGGGSASDKQGHHGRQCPADSAGQ